MIMPLIAKHGHTVFMVACTTKGQMAEICSQDTEEIIIIATIFIHLCGHNELYLSKGHKFLPQHALLEGWGAV